MNKSGYKRRDSRCRYIGALSLIEEHGHKCSIIVKCNQTSRHSATGKQSHYSSSKNPSAGIASIMQVVVANLFINATLTTPLDDGNTEPKDRK